jgi:hypothetical protein
VTPAEHVADAAAVARARLIADPAALEAGLARLGAHLRRTFEAAAEQLGISARKIGAALAKMRLAFLAEQARTERRRLQYLQRTARPDWARTTSPQFRAGTRRTKRASGRWRRRGK